MVSIKEQVSLKDIAKKIGVSAMTVSRVVNGTGVVKKETRDKILDAIKQMGYRKDIFASINAGKRKGIAKKKHVAINFPTAYFSEKEFFNFFSSITMKIISELQTMKIGYSIVHIDEEKELSDIDTILNSDAIIHCGLHSKGSYQIIKEYNPRAHHIGICFHDKNISCVLPDDAKGGELAATYFHNMGHEDVMCFSIKDDPSHWERTNSFSSKMQKLNSHANVDVLSYSYNEITHKITDKRNLLDKYFKNHNPSAIFVPNGYDTMIICKYLLDKGMKIPEDIGLLGYDELEFYDFLETPLSRIVFAPEVVGKTTVALLVNILEGRLQPGIKSLISVRLVDKGSVTHADKTTIKIRNKAL